MAVGLQSRSSEFSVGALDASEAARLIAAAADVVVMLDAKGLVRDVAFRDAALAAEFKDGGDWHGRQLTETLTVESRPKVAALLNAARQDREPRLRQVNHLSNDGRDIAIEYAAVQTRQNGPILAFGRDLRPLAALQQRLVDAQQLLDRDYALQRQTETRFRVLFDMSEEPLLLVDAHSLKVVEANPAARRIAGPGRRASGWALAELFATDRATVLRCLAMAQNAGSAGSMRVQLAAGPDGGPPGADATLATSLLVEEPAPVILARITPRGGSATFGRPDNERLLSAVEHAPDGFVCTGAKGEILTVNAAFLAMAQLHVEDQARGQALDRWLGQPGVDVEVLLANLRQRGSVQLFGTTLRGEHGQVREVEVSGAVMSDAAALSFGLVIRDVGRRIAPAPSADAPATRSVEQLTELIGRVPLKDLVRDATDVIERLCIEAALELTGDNRASAAEMLGLSRQSFYVKLRRYGLGDLDDHGAPEDA